MPNPFTAAPDFDNPVGWSDFVGSYVVLEPTQKHYQLTTKFGTQDAYDCVVWKLERDHLEPTPGIRIFNPKLVQSLDLAYAQGKPMAGFVCKGGRNGNATVLNDRENSPTMDLLVRLWNEGHPVTDTESETSLGDLEPAEDEESF
jgi:hypothetical protein